MFRPGSAFKIRRRTMVRPGTEAQSTNQRPTKRGGACPRESGTVRPRGIKGVGFWQILILMRYACSGLLVSRLALPLRFSFSRFPCSSPYFIICPSRPRYSSTTTSASGSPFLFTLPNHRFTRAIRRSYTSHSPALGDESPSRFSGLLSPLRSSIDFRDDTSFTAPGKTLSTFTFIH